MSSPLEFMSQMWKRLLIVVSFWKGPADGLIRSCCWAPREPKRTLASAVAAGDPRPEGHGPTRHGLPEIPLPAGACGRAEKRPIGPPSSALLHTTRSQAHGCGPLRHAARQGFQSRPLDTVQTAGPREERPQEADRGRRTQDHGQCRPRPRSADAPLGWVPATQGPTQGRPSARRQVNSCRTWAPRSF